MGMDAGGGRDSLCVAVERSGTTRSFAFLGSPFRCAPVTFKEAFSTVTTMAVAGVPEASDVGRSGGKDGREKPERSLRKETSECKVGLGDSSGPSLSSSIDPEGKGGGAGRP